MAIVPLVPRGGDRPPPPIEPVPAPPDATWQQASPEQGRDRLTGLRIEEPPEAPPASGAPARQLDSPDSPDRPERPERPKAPDAVLAAEQGRSPQAKPAAEVEAQAGDEASPDFFADAQAGVVILRALKAHPGAMLGFGWNLGKLLGWPGLFVDLDLDLFVGSKPLGGDFVIFDLCFGFTGRFSLGPVALGANLGFGMRHMVITAEAPGSSEDEPEPGFGMAAGLFVEWKALDFLSIVAEADGRYAASPSTGKFEFSGVFSGGVRFVF
ncbi:MAG: hypothetical protein JXR96_31020 [Deltaproteobacteria bacterium]|nr:hypothetical protein [Deltaproteobacteria bacterium]